MYIQQTARCVIKTKEAYRNLPGLPKSVKSFTTQLWWRDARRVCLYFLLPISLRCSTALILSLTLISIVFVVCQYLRRRVISIRPLARHNSSKFLQNLIATPFSLNHQSPSPHQIYNILEYDKYTHCTR